VAATLFQKNIEHRLTWIDCCRGEGIRRLGPSSRDRVPPAFRVIGEIIIADEDALTEEEITRIANSLRTSTKEKSSKQEWELCISLLHKSAGRVRATFYSATGIRK